MEYIAFLSFNQKALSFYCIHHNIVNDWAINIWHSLFQRKLRGYSIARLYHNVGEFELARRYISEFLSARPKAIDAYRLLGQIYEASGTKEKAVCAYKTAYELGGWAEGCTCKKWGIRNFSKKKKLSEIYRLANRATVPWNYYYYYSNWGFQRFSWVSTQAHVAHCAVQCHEMDLYILLELLVYDRYPRYPNIALSVIV